MDFSSMIKHMETDKYNRFFAGLPNVPKKNKNGMAIYESFLQHVIASLSDKGKAAVVVPTGFTTAASGIPKKIREHLVEHNWLRGIIHMPSNIFATTGTSVSIVFIDKTKVDNEVMLLDASNLGNKVSLEDGQRTVLSEEEKEKIMTFFKSRLEEPEFSVLVSNEDIKGNGYIVQAGQYVELREEIHDFNIDEKLSELSSKLNEDLTRSIESSYEVLTILRGVQNES
jgi:type I restriction enzyme M protein